MANPWICGGPAGCGRENPPEVDQCMCGAFWAELDTLDVPAQSSAAPPASVHPMDVIVSVGRAIGLTPPQSMERKARLDAFARELQAKLQNYPIEVKSVPDEHGYVRLYKYPTRPPGWTQPRE
jgi:hypothetical protein